MLPLYLLELVCAVAFAVLSPVEGPPPAVRNVGGVLVLAPRGDREERWYVLETESVGADGRARPRPVGVVCLRRVEGSGRLRLEAEFRYAAADSRVLFVEETGPGERRAVFRELTARAGRSVVVEETPGGDCTFLEWGGPVKRHGPLGVTGRLAFPLELAEAARTRNVADRPFEMLDPLAAQPVRVRASAVELEDGMYEVRYERDDGTLAAFYRVRSAQIVEFGWQRGGPRAREATAAEVAEAERRLRSGGGP